MVTRFTDEEKADGLFLTMVLTLPQTAGTAPSLPEAFAKARGQALPTTETCGNRGTRNAQLMHQQGVDKAKLARTMDQMGGRFGFRGKDN